MPRLFCDAGVFATQYAESIQPQNEQEWGALIISNNQIGIPVFLVHISVSSCKKKGLNARLSYRSDVHSTYLLTFSKNYSDGRKRSSVVITASKLAAVPATSYSNYASRLIPMLNWNNHYYLPSQLAVSSGLYCPPKTNLTMPKRLMANAPRSCQCISPCRVFSCLSISRCHSPDPPLSYRKRWLSPWPVALSSTLSSMSSRVETHPKGEWTSLGHYTPTAPCWSKDVATSAQVSYLMITKHLFTHPMNASVVWW